MNVNIVFSIVVPVIVGAIIGYFTNWLAIKMLFRPLKAVYIGKVRLPFTPGILPREKQGIARTLGETVSKDLLDESTVSARFKSPEFIESFSIALKNIVEKFLSSRPSDFSGSINPELSKNIRITIITALKSAFSSEAFKKSVEDGFDRSFISLEDFKFADLFTSESIKKIDVFFKDERIEKISEDVSKSVISFIKKQAQEDKTFISLLNRKTPNMENDGFRPEACTSYIEKVLNFLYPSLSNAFLEILNEPEVRRSMEKSGEKIIKGALRRFNSFQRLVISVGQYDTNIIENMPLVISDFTFELKTILAKDSTKNAIISSIEKSYFSFANKPLSKLPFLATEDKTIEAESNLSKAIYKTLKGFDSDLVIKLRDSICQDKTFKDILEAFPDFSIKISSLLIKILVRLFGNKVETDSNSGFAIVGKKVGQAFASSFADNYASCTLNDIINVSKDDIQTLVTNFAVVLSKILTEETSSLLKSLDIKNIVEDKINSLDMLEIERLLLRVMDKELKAITNLGGLLGAILGLFESLFMMFQQGIL